MHKKNRRNLHLIVTYIVRKYRQVLFTLLISFSLCLTVYEINLNIFKLKKIEVIARGIEIHIEQEMIPNQLLFVNSQKLRTQLLNQYPQLADVNIRKKIPDTLVITLETRSPAARVSTNRRLIDVDEQAIVLHSSLDNSASLPVLDFRLQDVADGTKLTDNRVVYCLKLLSGLSTEYMLANVVSLNEVTLRAKVSTTDIFFTQEANPKATAA
ncbi:hypothetical protein A2154_00950, partial [Candidatus Gottesmanbacteria bacterium RBG_16_43_7]